MGLGLADGRGYPEARAVYDDLQLELRRFNKLAALGERRGVSFVDLKL